MVNSSHQRLFLASMWLAWVCLWCVVAGCRSETIPPVAPQPRIEQSTTTKTAIEGRAESDEPEPTTAEDLDRIERELQIKLPTPYREFMLERSKELLRYTYPLRGETEYWFDSEFFGFN